MIGAGRAAQQCAAQGVVLRRRRLNWDRYRNREQCDGRVGSCHANTPLSPNILCDQTELFNLVAEVQHHDDMGVGTQSPSLGSTMPTSLTGTVSKAACDAEFGERDHVLDESVNEHN